MLILGIDPSVNNVGIALLDTDTDELVTQCFHPKRENQSLSQIGNQIARKIWVELLQGKKPDCLVLEYPQFEDSERGIVAMKQGYILDLAFIVGFLGSSFGVSASKIWTPSVKEWKGTTPKKAIEVRFYRRFPHLAGSKISDHEFEAAMLICWLMDQRVLIV